MESLRVYITGFMLAGGYQLWFLIGKEGNKAEGEEILNTHSLYSVVQVV